MLEGSGAAAGGAARGGCEVRALQPPRNDPRVGKAEGLGARGLMERREEGGFRLPWLWGTVPL